MAYMSQEKKASLAPGIKKVLNKYGVKGSIAVHHHSTLTVTLREGPFNFGEDFSVNPYWLADHYEGKQLAFLQELKEAMNVGNHDNSDIMTDYFDVGWYISIDIGKWDKPYKFISGGVNKPKKKRTVKVVVGKESLASKALQVYSANIGLSRQDLITKIVDELGIDTGDTKKDRVKAAGLYQQAKKRVEA